MITPFIIYLVSTMNSINTLFLVLVVISTAFSLPSGIGWFLNVPEGNYKEAKWCKKICIIFTCIAICSGILKTLTPSSETIAAMIVIPAVVNNEKIQGITLNSLTILQNMTEKWAKETIQVDKMVK